jgi:hypothetical protein
MVQVVILYEVFVFARVAMSLGLSPYFHIFFLVFVLSDPMKLGFWRRADSFSRKTFCFCKVTYSAANFLFFGLFLFLW